jgi:YVTN family beta-propeller protein
VAASAGAAPFAYVPNEGSNDVTVFDTATDTVVATIPVGLNPIRLAVTPDGRKVYVACIAADRVYVIDTASNTVLRNIAVQDGPAEVLASPDGMRIYVPNSGEGGGVGQSVSVIDVATDTVITNIPAGVNCRAIAWVANSAGRFVYVANQGAANVTVINHDTLTSPGNVPTGGGPRRLEVSPNNTRVYTSNFQSDSVTVIDAVQRRAIATVPVGDGPRGIAITPNGMELYCANLNTNFVSVINTLNNTVNGTITVGGGCWSVVVNSRGDRAYVVSSGDRNCYVIDTGSRQVIATPPIGQGAFWAKFNWDQSKLYVTNPDQGPPGTVTVIDTGSNTTIKNITTGDAPWIIDIQAPISRPGIRNASPSQVPRGCTVPVSVFGSNFVGGVTASIFPATSGVSVFGTTLLNSTNLIVTVVATTTASLNTTGLIVQNPGGASTTNTSLFTITGPPTPSLTKTVPNSMGTGTNVAMNVFGAGLQNGATLTLTPSNAGATLSSVQVVNYTNVTLMLSLSAAANSGTFGFRLNNPSGQSTTNTSLFTITGTAPTLTQAVPAAINAGSVTAMTVFGAGFQSGASLTVRPANAGIALSGITTVNSTNLSLTMTVAGTANTGTFGFIVQNPDGKSGTNTALYSILASLPPVPLRTVPTNIVAGSAAAMSLFGSNFQSGATLTLQPGNAGVLLSGVTFANATNINLTVSTAGTATLGTFGFIVQNPDGKRGTNASLFAIAAQPPALIRVSPTNVTAGTSAPMTVFGSNFLSGATLALTPANAGATLSAVTFVNATNLSVTVNTTTAAAQGAHGFIATNPDGKSVTNAGLFAITAPLPVLSSAAPNTITAGDSLPVNVTGAFFQSGAALTFTPSNTGVGLGSTTFINASNLTVTVTTTTGAALGTHGFIVANPDGKSATNAGLLTITAPRPVLAGATPTDLTAGAAVSANVFGNFFQSGATLALTPVNAGATLSAVTFVNATNLSVTVNTTTAATLGTHGFIVQNPDAKSATNAALFTISAPQPLLDNGDPTQVVAGTSVLMSLFGAHFQPGAVVSLAPGNTEVSLSSVSVVNATNITLDVSVSSNSTTTTHGFIVTNPDAKSVTNAALFTILPVPFNPPTLTGAAPTNVTAGAIVSMSVTGSNLLPGATLALEPPDANVTLRHLQILDEANLTVDVVTTTNAAPGARGFIVTNPNGDTGTNATLFEIVADVLPMPTLDSATPTNIVAGAAAVLELFGTGFQLDASLALDPPNAGATLSNLVIVTGTNATVHVDTVTTVALGVHGVILTNGDGQSVTNAALFEILPAPPPVLASAAPGTVTVGSSAPMNVYGAGFQAGATVALEPGNAEVALTGITIVNDTNITLTVDVTTNSVLGAHGFIAANPDGQSATNAALFSIIAQPPALTGADPVVLVAGTTAPMSALGSNFQAGATLALSPANAGVALSNIVVAGSTNITLDVLVASNATTGAHGFVVTNPDAQTATNAALFTILPPPPTLTGASPATVIAGTGGLMSVFGADFLPGASLALEPGSAGVGLSGVTVVNATNLTLTMVIASNATTGAHGFIVTNPTGQSGTNAALFVIDPPPPVPPPSLLSAQPNEVATGTNAAMTVFGAAFQNGGTLTLYPPGADVTLSDVVVADETNITVTVIAAGTAALGPRGFVMTNPDGQAATNASLFAIVPAPVPPPSFVDVTASAGVTIPNVASRGSPLWGDLNNDGALDFIVPTGNTNIFVFLNRGDGTFSNFTSRTGIVPGAATIDSRRWFGFALADYDEDGNLDLFITEDTRQPGNGSKNDLLWRGYGTGEFTNMTAVAGVANPTGRGSAAFWVDYDADGCLDLFIENFNTPSALYASAGCGATTNRAAAAGLAAATAATNVSWADYDSDGLPDLCVTGSATNDVLWLNRGDGTFSNVTSAAGLAAATAGQGIGWGDYDGDGYVDLFIARGFNSSATNQSVQATLYRNNGDGTFADVTAAAGLSSATNNNWAGVWGDYDNDGRLDLFVTAAGTPGASGNANRLFHNNGDGTFSDLAGTANVQAQDNATFHVGAAWADYDNDGFLDLLVKNGVGIVAQGIQLFRNAGNGHHYLKLVLRGATSNRGALGALVQVTAGGHAQLQQATGGGGGELFSQSSAPLHFGLGTNTSAVVDVLWPTGAVEQFGPLSADTTVVLVEGAAGQPAGPAPQIFSVTPTNVNAGSRLTMTVEGADFQLGATAVVTPAGLGARVDHVNFVDAATLSLELMIDATATLGDRGLMIANPDGQTVAATPLFSIVTVPPPVIDTVTPSTVLRGRTTVLTVTGSGFQPGLTATVPNPRGVTVTQVNVLDSTTVQVTISVSPTATRATRNLRVQNPDGQLTTKVAAFTVN